MSSSAPPPAQELDVRQLAKPEKHPRIFALFESLPTGGSFVLVNDHNPVHLHQEFERDLPGDYAWETLSSEPRNWRILITKQAGGAPLRG